MRYYAKHITLPIVIHAKTQAELGKLINPNSASRSTRYNIWRNVTAIANGCPRYPVNGFHITRVQE